MENSLVLATREIMWNIPYSLKITMYLLLLLSVGVFFKGLYQKLKFVTNGGPISLIWKEKLFVELNWGNFLKTVFLTGKVPRVKSVSFFHSLIFYGFFILWIATDLVAIHYDTPLKIFTGRTYIIVSFLADFAGLALLLGLFFAYYRRYIKKPNYLEASSPRQELYMYGILFWLVVLGFFLEGLRILGNNFPINERTWSPIGWLFAQFFALFNFSDSTLANIYRALWFIHMANTMLFIATIPISKFCHILFIPINSLITPQRRGGVLNPISFEDEEKETFGLSNLSELSAKNRFDLLACVECGRCTQVCPANNAGKNLNPKTIITKLRDFALTSFKDKKLDADIWENPLYSSNELDSCTTCGACMEECPAHIEHIPLIMEAKRYKALTLGDLPPSAADAVNKIRINGNPWGVSQDDRFKWAEGLEVPVIEEGKKVDYLYYVGCAGSYDASNQKVVRDTVTLLKKANVNFAVLGKTEKCNGDPIRRFGDEYSFFEIAIENIANLNQYQFDKIVTHCPHCLHTIGKEYAKFEDGAFETLHHTELLSDLLKTKKLLPQKSLKETFTFHDPCYLGRHHGEYNAPREILQYAGVEIKEMENNKDKSLCCGMGGGNMWYELPEGEDLASKRLEQISQESKEKLATACSYCMINFNSSKSEKTKTENLEIEDVATILSRSMD